MQEHVGHDPAHGANEVGNEDEHVVNVVGQPVGNVVINFVHDPAHGVDPAPGGGLLLAAARRGDVAQVQAELAAGTPVDFCHEHSCNRTALIVAAVEGHADVVSTLLAAGASREHRDSAHQQTALEKAQERGHSAVMNLLMAND